MKTTYGDFNKNGAAIQTLAKTKIKDFRVKMKVARLNKWVSETGELLAVGLTAIKDKFPTKPSDFNEKGVYIGKDMDAFSEKMKKKTKEEDTLYAEEIEVPNITFTETELKPVDVDGSVFTALAILGVFSFEVEKTPVVKIKKK